jgi:hypothetical protein
VQCKVDTLYAFDLLREYIEYIHIKDAVWETGEVVPSGMGSGKISRLYQSFMI